MSRPPTYEPGFIRVRITTRQAEALKRMVDEAGLGVSELMRRALDQFILNPAGTMTPVSSLTPGVSPDALVEPARPAGGLAAPPAPLGLEGSEAQRELERYTPRASSYDEWQRPLDPDNPFDMLIEKAARGLDNLREDDRA